MRTTQAALDEAKAALAGATTDHDREYWQGLMLESTMECMFGSQGLIHRLL